MKHSTMREMLDGELGFVTGVKFEKQELEKVRTIVKTQWLNCIKQAVPQYVEAFAERGIDRYHELAHLIDHHQVWSSVKNRLLPASAVAELRTMSIFQKLEAELGSFTIPDPYNWVTWEPIYFRLVRPEASSDVGPLHTDQWFWDLQNQTIPSGKVPFKVWIAIECEPGLSGLRIVPGSHLKRFPYHGEMRHGIIKPQIDFKEEELEIELFHSNPGEAIVFNHWLLHGGAVTEGSLTRVSLEFTILVDN